MKRAIIVFIILFVSGLVLSGCDAGNRIIGLEIENYPDNIIYVADVDNTLSLSGGSVNVLVADGRKFSYDMYDSEISYAHDIDFDKPGIYQVDLYRSGDFSCSFPVQVVQSCER